MFKLTTDDAEGQTLEITQTLDELAREGARRPQRHGHSLSTSRSSSPRRLDRICALQSNTLLRWRFVLESFRCWLSSNSPVRLGDFVDQDFHCILGDTQIHKNLGYALNHSFGRLLPKTFPHAHMNNRHSTPLNANSLRSFPVACQPLPA
jgi:hypothetical protein